MWLHFQQLQFVMPLTGSMRCDHQGAEEVVGQVVHTTESGYRATLQRAQYPSTCFLIGHKMCLALPQSPFQALAILRSKTIIGGMQ